MNHRLFKLVLFVCICLSVGILSGCKKKSPAPAEKPATAVPPEMPFDKEKVQEAIENAEVNAKSEFDFEVFIKLLSSKQYHLAYDLLSSGVQAQWPRERFNADIEKVHTRIGQKWNSQQIEFMHYPGAQGDLYTAVYDISPGSDNSFTVQMIASKQDQGYKLAQVRIMMLCGDGDAAGQWARDVAGELLECLKDSQVESLRAMMVPQAIERITAESVNQMHQVFAIQGGFPAVLSDDVHENLINGNMVYSATAHPAEKPMSVLEIMMLSADGKMLIAGMQFDAKQKVGD